LTMAGHAAASPKLLIKHIRVRNIYHNIILLIFSLAAAIRAPGSRRPPGCRPAMFADLYLT
jgi:hypothetical protein